MGPTTGVKCAACQGTGIVMVSRDPDYDVDCLVFTGVVTLTERITTVRMRLKLSHG